MDVRTYSETYIGIKWNEKEREKKWAYFPPSQGFILFYLLILLDKTSKNIYRKISNYGERKERKKKKHGSPTIAFAPK